MRHDETRSTSDGMYRRTREKSCDKSWMLASSRKRLVCQVRWAKSKKRGKGRRRWAVYILFEERPSFNNQVTALLQAAAVLQAKGLIFQHEHAIWRWKRLLSCCSEREVHGWAKRNPNGYLEEPEPPQPGEGHARYGEIALVETYNFSYLPLRGIYGVGDASQLLDVSWT